MRYVVGMKDSARGRAALRWALRSASDVGASIEVVTAFQVPMVWSPETGSRPHRPAEARAEARARQAQAVQEAIGRALHELDVDVDVQVRNGDPVEVLVEESSDADLLVVGAPDPTPLGFLHRSVARRVARRAQCPVVVVDQRHAPKVTARSSRVPQLARTARLGRLRRSAA